MAKIKMVVNGQYVQVCKKWSKLTRNQKEWIMTKAKNQYKKITDTQHRPITNIEKREILHSIYSQVQDKGIWLPYCEIGRVLSSKIAKWNKNKKMQYSQVNTFTVQK